MSARVEFPTTKPRNISLSVATRRTIARTSRNALFSNCRLFASAADMRVRASPNTTHKVPPLFPLPEGASVVVYDGKCRFCEAQATAVLHYSASPTIYIATHQSEAGRALMQRFAPTVDGKDTVLFVDELARPFLYGAAGTRSYSPDRSKNHPP